MKLKEGKGSWWIGDRNGSSSEVLLVAGDQVVCADLEGCSDLHRVLEVRNGKSESLLEVRVDSWYHLEESQEISDSSGRGRPVITLSHDVVDGRKGVGSNEPFRYFGFDGREKA